MVIKYVLWGDLGSGVPLARQEPLHKLAKGQHSRDVCMLYLVIFTELPHDLSIGPDPSIFQIIQAS